MADGRDLGAMRSRHELGGAVPGPEWIEECQRGNRFGGLAIEAIAMQCLRAAIVLFLAPHRP